MLILDIVFFQYYKMHTSSIVCYVFESLVIFQDIYHTVYL